MFTVLQRRDSSFLRIAPASAGGGWQECIWHQTALALLCRWAVSRLGAWLFVSQNTFNRYGRGPVVYWRWFPSFSGCFPLFLVIVQCFLLLPQPGERKNGPELKSGLNCFIIYPFLQSTTCDSIVQGMWWDPGVKCNPTALERLHLSVNGSPQKPRRKLGKNASEDAGRNHGVFPVWKDTTLVLLQGTVPVASGEIKPGSQDSFCAILLATSLHTWCPKRCKQS